MGLASAVGRRSVGEVLALGLFGSGLLFSRSGRWFGSNQVDQRACYASGSVGRNRGARLKPLARRRHPA